MDQYCELSSYWPKHIKNIGFSNFLDNGYDIKVYLNELLLARPVVGGISGFKTYS